MNLSFHHALCLDDFDYETGCLKHIWSVSQFLMCFCVCVCHLTVPRLKSVVFNQIQAADESLCRCQIER